MVRVGSPGILRDAGASPIYLWNRERETVNYPIWFSPKRIGEAKKALDGCINVAQWSLTREDIPEEITADLNAIQDYISGTVRSIIRSIERETR